MRRCMQRRWAVIGCSTSRTLRTPDTVMNRTRMLTRSLDVSGTPTTSACGSRPAWLCRQPPARACSQPLHACDNGAQSKDHAVVVIMNRTDVLQQLASSKAELARRYGVMRLALFGSVARGSSRPDSDVDILVAFDGPATSSRYFGVQFFLEDLLGCRVDLVTDKALRAELRPYVEREAVRV